MNLLLITKDYPYGSGEQFIRDEIEQLCQNNLDVYILPSSNKGKKRSFPKNLFLLESISFKDLIFNLPFVIIKYGSILFWDLIAEITLEKQKFLYPSRFIPVLAYFYRAIKLVIFLEKKSLINPSKTLFYSYWMNSECYGLSLFVRRNNKQKIKFVSRVHGGDLYLERNHQYLPFREIIFSSITRVFSISYNGKHYIEQNYGESIGNKVYVSRLGVKKSQIDYIENYASSSLTFISCSSDISIKRVGLILEVLQHVALLSSKDIEWFHAGIEVNKFNKKYKQKNNIKNLKITSLGIISNESIIENYKEISPDIFINYSSTEGIPFSIMEALSCGIPVFATDVGGTSEIIDERVGSLVGVESSTKDSAKVLIELVSRIQGLDINAYERWNSKCNAVVNYKEHTILLNSVWKV